MSTISARYVVDESALPRLYAWLLGLARDNDDQAQPAVTETPVADAEEADAVAARGVHVVERSNGLILQ